jgi:hypothetical protein
MRRATAQSGWGTVAHSLRSCALQVVRIFATCQSLSLLSRQISPLRGLLQAPISSSTGGKKWR